VEDDPGDYRATLDVPEPLSVAVQVDDTVTPSLAPSPSALELKAVRGQAGRSPSGRAALRLRAGFRARALGAGGAVRNDLATASGLRIEVKSAAYQQAWAQRVESSISFDGPSWKHCGVAAGSPPET
jgi:hypothetical protein